LTGDPINADEANRIGLVERLAPKGEALAEAIKLAKRVLLRGPVAVVNAKKTEEKTCAGLRKKCIRTKRLNYSGQINCLELFYNQAWFVTKTFYPHSIHLRAHLSSNKRRQYFGML